MGDKMPNTESPNIESFDSEQKEISEEIRQSAEQLRQSGEQDRKLEEQAREFAEQAPRSTVAHKVVFSNHQAIILVLPEFGVRKSLNTKQSKDCSDTHLFDLMSLSFV
jgi:hypothetical protein